MLFYNMYIDMWPSVINVTSFCVRGCVIGCLVIIPSPLIVFRWTPTIFFRRKPNMVLIHSTVEKNSKKNARYYSRDYPILVRLFDFMCEITEKGLKWTKKFENNWQK